MEKEFDALTIRLWQVCAEIQRQSPRYAAFTQPQTLPSAEIQQPLNLDTLLLGYALGEERSYLWLVRRYQALRVT